MRGLCGVCRKEGGLREEREREREGRKEGRKWSERVRGRGREKKKGGRSSVYVGGKKEGGL